MPKFSLLHGGLAGKGILKKSIWRNAQETENVFLHVVRAYSTMKMRPKLSMRAHIAMTAFLSCTTVPVFGARSPWSAAFFSCRHKKKVAKEKNRRHGHSGLRFWGRCRQRRNTLPSVAQTVAFASRQRPQNLPLRVGLRGSGGGVLNRRYLCRTFFKSTFSLIPYRFMMVRTQSTMSSNHDRRCGFQPSYPSSHGRGSFVLCLRHSLMLINIPIKKRTRI